MQGMLILEYNLYVLEWERVPKKILITEMCKLIFLWYKLPSFSLVDSKATP